MMATLPTGYTPLHMAAGYMHTTTMGALLEASANPQLKDNNGKDVVGLIGKLRAEMPLSPMTIQRRIALEQVASVLTDRVYDEVEPAKVWACARCCWQQQRAWCMCLAAASYMVHVVGSSRENVHEAVHVWPQSAALVPHRYVSPTRSHA